MQTPGFFETRERSVVQYIREIADSRPLSLAEEAELARLMREGDLDARNRLVYANLRFVVRVALEYRERGLSLGELISAGNMGLFSAAERFDETRGFRFITYAVWWVRQTIVQALMAQRSIRLPVNRLDRLVRVSKSLSGLMQKLHGDPAVEDIASELGLTLQEVEQALIESRLSVSLDEEIDEESGRTPLSALSDGAQQDPDAALDWKRMQQEISAVLGTLSGRKSEILRLYYGMEDGEGLTLEQIGARLGLSRERVRQVKHTALSKLRTAGRARSLYPYLKLVT